MPERLDVLKTYKLFIDGKFPRSESGRSLIVHSPKGRVVAHACLASRKDLRDSVEAARKAQEKWADATPYLRGQILYRMAEMMEGKRLELAEAIAAATRLKSPKDAAAEVSTAIDRVVRFAGWADKYAHVLGCQNPASGPYYNFTVPEPTGVVAVIAPDERPLLALVSLMLPAMVPGNTIVALASPVNPLPACVLAEVIATSDVPPGVINILTSTRAEILPHVAVHRDVDAVHAAGLADDERAALRAGVAENVKRVTLRAKTDWDDHDACGSPWWIEPFVEMKTIWHPSSV